MLPLLASSSLFIRLRAGIRCGMRTSLLVAGAIALAVGFMPATGFAQGMPPPVARVISVADGDTVTVLDSHRQRYSIRLADIDAPESCKARGQREDDMSSQACNGRPGQPFSDKARIALRAITIGQDVQLQCRELDRYGRAICRIYVGTTDVNAELVKNGLAWYETRYGRDRQLEAMWRDAMRRQVGIFSDPLAVQPSAWRRHCWNQGVCDPRQIRELTEN